MKQMTKKKFISSIVGYAFLFVLLSCLVGYGAWAILNANFNLGGNISFEANNILATISAGQVSGGTLTDSASKLQAITINTTDNGQTAMQTWNNLDLHFNDNGDDVTITFTITNNHTEKALLVEVGEITGTKTNATVSVTADGESAESVVIPANSGTPSSVEYVVTFSVTEKDKSASITGFSIPISMENAETYTATVIVEYDGAGGVSDGTWHYTTNTGVTHGGYGYDGSEYSTTETFTHENIISITFYNDNITRAPAPARILVSWTDEEGEPQSFYVLDTGSSSGSDGIEVLGGGLSKTITLTQDTTFTISNAF